MAAPESLFGLWIEQEIIMSPLHCIEKITPGAYCGTQARPARRGDGRATGPAGLSSTAPSGAANLSESGVTSPNTGSIPVLQLSMEF
jgi:hypothetical protein